MVCSSVGSLVPGPIKPATHRGRPSAWNPSTTSRARRAATWFSSTTRSAMSYSPSTIADAPKEFVSTTSAPASRQAKYAWTMREVSGPQAGPEAPARPEAPTGPVLPPRGVLRDEVLLVLGLSLAASAVYALVDLLSAPIRGVSAPLFANTALI